MTHSANLAALLGSRICHDLISPIGAVGNGVELMMMETLTPSPEMALIAESVATANARIRFFRIAFGMTSEQSLSRNEITKVLDDNNQGARMSVEWKPTGDISRNEAKLGFLAILCCETALSYGGRITVSVDGNKWQIHANAARLRIEPELWSSLSNPSPDLTPAQVHFALFAAEISQQKRRLMADVTETDIRLSY